MTPPARHARSFEPPNHAAPSLVSLSAGDRRAALEGLASRGLRDEDVEAVSALLSDPERDIRAFAVTVLTQRADRIDSELIRRALRDPADEVRAATVRLAAQCTGVDLALLVPLTAARRWPLTQQAALEVLPRLIDGAGIDDESLDALLAAVAGLESPPIGEERFGFADLARTIGSSRLIGALTLPDDRRLAGVRLLLEEGSTESLRAIAELGTDPLDEVRAAAANAGNQLAVIPFPKVPLPDTDEEQATPEAVFESPTEAHPAGVEREVIAGLARALEDPDEGVRERAERALGAVDREWLVAWTKETLRAGDERDAGAAAGVTEVESLQEVAGDLLQRAALARPEDRGPLIGALSSLELDGSELVALASAIDAANRPEAVRLLWQVAGRGVLSPLRTMLEDPAGPVRVAALEVFGGSGDPSGIEAARGALEGDSSPVVRATAIRVISRAGRDERRESLARVLVDPDPDVRATAVELLPQGMGGEAGDLLLQAIGDEDDRVWQPAMRHLVALPDGDLSVLWKAIRDAPEDRRDNLVSLLERTGRDRLAVVASEHLGSAEPSDRMLAVSLASRAGTARSMEGIIGALADPSPAVRRAAAAILALHRSPEAIPALGSAMNDPDAGVREEAIRTISGFDDESVLDPLVEALKDPEPRVREVAGDALLRWSSPAVARRLVVALTSSELRGPASELLARIGTSALDPLLRLLRGDPGTAAAVGETLERLVTPSALVERLGSMDPAERLSAVEALGAMGGLEAVEGLTRALSDPKEEIRVRALQRLGDLRDPRAIDAVERAARGDPVPEVVAAAEEALRRIRAP